MFRGLHYNSDAQALVVVIDCDDTELHELTHDPIVATGCRLCRARQIIAQARKQLRPVLGKPELKVAIGLTVPAIEAWYLVGKNHEVGEAAWRAALKDGRRLFTRPQLKNLVYGTDRPSLEYETECAVREARRIAANVQQIESAFPAGFGSMATDIRSWGQ